MKNATIYKAVLFDLDGTLTESGPGITRCVQYALEKLGKPEPDLEKLNCFVGPPLKEQFMSYAGLSDEEGTEAVRLYRERYESVGILENRVYDGIYEMLKELKAAGLTLAVASSKPEVYVKRILKHFELEPFFDLAVGSELGGARTDKAEVIREALKRLGLENQPSAVLMAGDKSHDVNGARKMGLDCVAVAWGYGTPSELREADPFLIVETPGELVSFFHRSR